MDDDSGPLGAKFVNPLLLGSSDKAGKGATVD